MTYKYRNCYITKSRCWVKSFLWLFIIVSLLDTVFLRTRSDGIPRERKKTASGDSPKPEI